MAEKIRMSNFAMAAALLLALGAATDARADIFKWTDDQGTLHFTDDPASIPAAKREQSTAPFIKEPPKSASPAEPANRPAPAAGEPASPPTVVSPVSGEDPTEALQREIEQQKAKIAAKESLIRYVDEKRSLATNPTRNRIVSAADLELYDKYQSEIASDRERLRQLEAQLRQASP
ncbi:MAG TPA: DUF4124 domain-containing protein [Candidatus Deferrimicrobiaceae bacterium]